MYFALLLLYVEAFLYSRIAAPAGKDIVRTIAAVTAGGMEVALLLNFFKEMYVWRRSYRDDQEAHHLEDMFKAELKTIFQASGAHKLDQTGKIYDSEELVDLEMAQKLHEVFETVRSFARMIVTYSCMHAVAPSMVLTHHFETLARITIANVALTKPFLSLLSRTVVAVQYKLCYNQVVAQVREDTEDGISAFELPPEPLMET